ncbi:MAG: TM1812 family CRISPR-associated protein [Lachnospira sp.]
MAEQQDVNIMITNVSVINRYLKNEYTDESGQYADITGYITNEAPVKYLMQKLNATDEKLDKLILIASDDVNQKVEIKLQKDEGNKKEVEQFEADYGNGKMTSVEILEDKIAKFSIEKNIPCPEFEVVELSDGVNGDGFSEISDTAVVNAVDKVNCKLIDESRKCRNLNVYIESNGGVRYVIVMLLSVMNILEKVYANIKLQGVYSMIYNKKTEDKKIPILDTSMTYASIELFSAMNEFIYYGRAKALEDYFEKRFTKRKESDEKYDPVIFQDIKKCINKLQKIADDMQLCRTEQIIDNFYESESIRDVLNKFKDTYANEKDPDSKIFLSVIENIRSEYNDIYDNPNPNTFLNLPKIIKWCIDKDYIQQALTLCSERLPQYFIESGILCISDKLRDCIQENISDNTNAEKYELSYYMISTFFNSIYREWILYIKVEEILSMYDKEWVGEKTVTKAMMQEFRNKFKEYTTNEKKIPSLLKRHQSYWAEQLRKNGAKEQYLECIHENMRALVIIKENVPKNGTFSVGGKEVKKWIKNLNLQELYPSYVEQREIFLKQIQAEKSVDLESHREDACKYNFFDLFDNEYLYADDIEHFIPIMVLYGILKGQRNLSNHASEVHEDSEKYVLTMNQIKSIITWELEKIEEYNKINGEVKDVH